MAIKYCMYLLRTFRVVAVPDLEIDTNLGICWMQIIAEEIYIVTHGEAQKMALSADACA